MTIEDLGWDAQHAAALDTIASEPQHAERTLVPARIMREDRTLYRIRNADGDAEAILGGRLRNEKQANATHPAVGDWVALERDPAGGRPLIRELLPRRSCLARRAIGTGGRGGSFGGSGEQVIAANVDAVFIVMSMSGDRGVNPRRLERYLTLVWDSGARPVVLLTKADIAIDPALQAAEIERVAQGSPVHALSAMTGDGLDALAPYLAPGVTSAAVGPSGSGKSTLINALAGTALRTWQVRDNDGRGRHTTTWRELVPLASGGLLVDTPGMRDVQVWGDDGHVDGVFADVAEFASDCKFADCRHDSEPGCAVQAAIERGAIDGERLESWRKLGRELAYLDSRRDERSAAEERKRRRMVTAGHRKIQQQKRRSRGMD
jgi:ribosome biogenesis GTPase